MFRDFGKGDDEIHETWTQTYIRADALMRRKDIRAAVKALAAALLDRWTIEGDEAVQIIDKAAGWPPAMPTVDRPYGRETDINQPGDAGRNTKGLPDYGHR
jgi:hypothetical protein